MHAMTTVESPFALLELPDGRWCVARPTIAKAVTLIAGSFAPLEGVECTDNDTNESPVGVYASREEAELAIQRTAPARRAPLSCFAAWLPQD